MSQKIELEIQYLADDYARSAVFFQKRRFLTKYLPLFPVGVIAIALASIFIKEPDKFLQAFTQPRNMIVVLIPVGFILIWFLVRRSKSDPLARRNFGKQIKSSPALQEPKIITIDDEGIRGKQSLGSSETRWDAFIEAEETDDDYYLFTSSRTAQFIPKRVFATIDQQEEFRALIATKLGKRAKLLQ